MELLASGIVGLAIGAALVWLLLGARLSAARAECAASTARVNDVEMRLIRPVEERLARVDRELEAIGKDRAANHAQLTAHLRTVVDAQRELAGETQRLVQALRRPHVRGQWGELQLRRVVELAGMREHCDFDLQASVQTVDGRLRPDMIVHLPGDKLVVVDAKAPIDAYLDAAEAADEGGRTEHLDRHATHVRQHIEQLAGKEYADQFSATPDFVVMFLPGESFFSAACERDPNLIEFAVRRNVIPASPTTLITVLKAVYYGWQQERIARNAEEIRDLGQDLYHRMRTVGEHLARVHKGLSSAVDGYNAAVGSLESRVLPTLRRLHELGVADGDGELEPAERVDGVPRLPSAPELTAD